MRSDIVVQIGLTSDLCSHYAKAAHSLGLRAWLVERAERLATLPAAWDRVIAVENPACPRQVIDALASWQGRIAVIIPGCDPCLASAHAAVAQLGAGTRSMTEDVIPTKSRQRIKVRSLAPLVRQPMFLAADCGAAEQAVKMTGIPFPVIVKPVGGSGGVGVCLVRTPHDLTLTIRQIAGLHDRYGEPYREVLIEEYVTGSPCSVQGLVVRGEPHVYTCTEQIIVHSPVPLPGAAHGFAERGHIVRSVLGSDSGLRQMAADVLAAIGYRNGPFYLDLIRSDGTYFFIEAGLRLSAAGVVDLVNEVANVDWARNVLTVLSSRAEVERAGPQSGLRAVGQLTINGGVQCAAARSLALGVSGFEFTPHSSNDDGLVTFRHRHPRAVRFVFRLLSCL